MTTVFSRPSGRTAEALRPVSFTRHYTKHAAGSVLVAFGETKVLCTATVEERIPGFLRDKKQGWLTAEYSMLPGSTHTRHARETQKPSGRSQEIQRLIGRSLRAAVDLTQIGERTIYLDCDVLQADGGTRTASITGAYVALYDALQKLDCLHALQYAVAAVSVGIYHHVPILDLEYLEDSQCETDMNVVMTSAGGLIEVQGTAEGVAFSRTEMNHMLDLAEQGIQTLFALQKEALAQHEV